MKTMIAGVVAHKKNKMERARFESLSTEDMFDTLDAAFAELIAGIVEAPRENAGFTIIAAQRVDSITEIVLGRREIDGEYVTWVCYCGNDYNWGHYFGPEQLVDSMKDFITRCAKEG